MVVTIVAQSVFLQCMCYTGMVRFRVAAIVDLVIAVRVLVALVRREQGRGWVFYLLLGASTLAWVPLIVNHGH